MKGGVKAMAMAGKGPCRDAAGRSLILTYHSVGTRDHEMNVAPGDFRAQMEWLAGHCTVVPAAAAAKGEGGVALTFDDGFRDNLTHAAPVLLELGLPAAVFVVAGRLGAVLDGEGDPERGALLSWEELAEWESVGMEVGAHSLTHRRLSALSQAEQREEIAGCARRLEEGLGHGVAGFAYPYGSVLDYTELSKSLVREAGFQYGLSNRYGTNGGDGDRWALRRIWVDRSDTLDTFAAKVDGRLDRLAWLDSRVAIRGRRLLNRLLGTV